MFLADRHLERLSGHVWVVPLAAVALTAALCARAFRLPGPARNATGSSGEIQLKWRGASPAGDPDWGVLRSGDGSPPTGGGSLARRFRLAGTFFAYAEGVRDQRKAVLHDLKSGRQTVVEEKQQTDGVTVMKIYHDRIVLRGDSGEEELWLGFTSQRTGGVDSTAASADAGGAPAAAAVAGKTRFGGKRVGPYSYVFRRDTLLEYYKELRQEPARLYTVFDSMKPIYGEGKQIFGYQLGIEGEEEFWQAAGLQEGDIVRKVNSVMMSNRRRAEFFISQFVKNENSIFLLDIERNGEPKRFSYHIR